MAKTRERVVHVQDGFMDEVVALLAVDEWDMSTDDGTPEELPPPSRVMFTRGQLARVSGLSAVAGSVDRALLSLMEGDDGADLLTAMMDEASDRTGWCILRCHAERPQGPRNEGNLA